MFSKLKFFTKQQLNTSILLEYCDLSCNLNVSVSIFDSIDKINTGKDYTDNTLVFANIQLNNHCSSNNLVADFKKTLADLFYEYENNDQVVSENSCLYIRKLITYIDKTSLENICFLDENNNVIFENLSKQFKIIANIYKNNDFELLNNDHVLINDFYLNLLKMNDVFDLQIALFYDVNIQTPYEKLSLSYKMKINHKDNGDIEFNVFKVEDTDTFFHKLIASFDSIEDLNLHFSTFNASSAFIEIK